MAGFYDEILPLILAGGRGTRISHLYPDLPKPAVPVAGRPFLAWVLKQLREAGFSRTVVSSGHLARQLRDKTSPWVPDGLEVRWICEDSPLGTGGGAAHAAKQSGCSPQAWLVMNGDSYLAGDWITAVRRMPSGEMAIVSRKMADTGRYGRLETEGGNVVCFGEKQESGPGLINAGIYLIPADLMAGVSGERPSSLERDWIPRWLAEGRLIRSIEAGGGFLDIGTPESLLGAATFLATHAPSS